MPSSDGLLGTILERLRVVRGSDSRGEYVCWCLFHADGKGEPPHQPNLYVSERGFFCHACREKRGVQELAADLGVKLPADVTALQETYDYHDEKGEVLFQAVRHPGKKFVFRRPSVTVRE